MLVTIHRRLELLSAVTDEDKNDTLSLSAEIAEYLENEFVPSDLRMRGTQLR